MKMLTCRNLFNGLSVKEKRLAMDAGAPAHGPEGSEGKVDLTGVTQKDTETLQGQKKILAKGQEQLVKLQANPHADPSTVKGLADKIASLEKLIRKAEGKENADLAVDDAKQDAASLLSNLRRIVSPAKTTPPSDADKQLAASNKAVEAQLAAPPAVAGHRGSEINMAQLDAAAARAAQPDTTGRLNLGTSGGPVAPGRSDLASIVPAGTVAPSAPAKTPAPVASRKTSPPPKV